MGLDVIEGNHGGPFSCWKDAAADAERHGKLLVVLSQRLICNFVYMFKRTFWMLY